MWEVGSGSIFCCSPCNHQSIRAVNQMLSACCVVLQISPQLASVSLPPSPSTFYCRTSSLETNDLGYNCLRGQRNEPPAHTRGRRCVCLTRGRIKRACKGQISCAESHYRAPVYAQPSVIYIQITSGFLRQTSFTFVLCSF